MKLKEVHIRWLGIPVVALISMLTNQAHLVSESFLMKFFIASCFTAVYWNGSFLIIGYFRKRIPEISLTSQRLILTALSLIVWMTFAGAPLKLVFMPDTLSMALSFDSMIEFMPFNFGAALVITLTYEAFYFFKKWKETFRQNEELKNLQIRTQYEVLQNQMSPHFLFNSLNTLTTVIEEDPTTAIIFTENLSEVYRYILHNKERELVALHEELDFVHSYLFLLRMRYPDNLTVDFEIQKKYHLLNLPPLTLQMLVENAIKHNVVSKSKPLHIDVYVENGNSVIVRNNLQEKESLGESTKTGLENIRKRYAILTGQEVDVITSATNFMVAVPLIEVMQEKDLKEL